LHQDQLESGVPRPHGGAGGLQEQQLLQHDRRDPPRRGEAYLDACANPAFNRITIDGPAVIGWDQVLDEAETMIAASLAAARERGEISGATSPALARMLAAALKEAAVMIAIADDAERARAEARDSARQLIGGLLRAL
jgi:hypothetical protein